jgi:acylphosphatase
MTDIVCRRFLVTGHVQGVFFRQSTARQASELAIGGHAVNLRDGRVEVLACGERCEVAKLADWLKDGPPAARVDTVSVEEVDCQAEFPGRFRTG